MRLKIFLFYILTIFTPSLMAQEIYAYEKKIDQIESYSSKVYKVAVSDDVNLWGTLISPNNDFEEVVVIVPGSGPISQYNHNFLVEGLLEKNIGVFRFDKRGIGKSGGNRSGDVEQYASDLKFIMSSLRKDKALKNKKIGAIGQSLGGLATIEAFNKKAEFDFLVQWGTPVGKPRQIVSYQMRNGSNNYDEEIIGNTLMDRLNTVAFVHETIDQYKDQGTWEIWKAIKKKARKENIRRKAFKNYVKTSFVDFAKLDNTDIYRSIDIPVLYIIGTNDKLVDPYYTINSLQNINNSIITVKEFTGLNHFLKENDIKMSEITNEIYNINEDAKRYIINWIRHHPD